MPNWVLEGLIATSPRPGFSPGPELTVHDHVVDAQLRTGGFECHQCGQRGLYMLHQHALGDLQRQASRMDRTGRVVRYILERLETTEVSDAAG